MLSIINETVEISSKMQGPTGPEALKKSLKTQISASFFGAFPADFLNTDLTDEQTRAKHIQGADGVCK